MRTSICTYVRVCPYVYLPKLPKTSCKPCKIVHRETMNEFKNKQTGFCLDLKNKNNWKEQKSPPSLDCPLSIPLIQPPKGRKGPHQKRA